MGDMVAIIGSLLAAIAAYFGINRLVFYTKAEVDKLIAKVTASTDDQDGVIEEKLQRAKEQFVNQASQIKEDMFEKLLEAERANNKSIQELYNKLNQNKQEVEDQNRKLLEAISQLKQDEKEITNSMLQIVNTVKDELKNDYISRYNDLLKLIGTKANASDFERIENKFDKVCETLTELKTVVQLQLDRDK